MSSAGVTQLAIRLGEIETRWSATRKREPETGLEEINRDFPEADFGPSMTSVHLQPGNRRGFLGKHSTTFGG
jgi:hypothetical protein